MTSGVSGHSALPVTMQGDEMLQPEEVAAMVRLNSPRGLSGSGWGLPK